MGSVPAIIRTSYPLEVMEHLAESSTAIEQQIETPPGTKSEDPARADTGRKIRGRHGGLGRERAQKVHAIRKLRACFHCWARKTPVSQRICQQQQR
jgi:hypothetical protein